MKSKEISDSNQYLKKIEGGNLVSVGRAASMAWFLFVKDNEEFQPSKAIQVDDVFMNQLGDLTIQLSENVKIEVFINMSEEECWRFFQRHTGYHLVVGVEGILE